MTLEDFFTLTEMRDGLSSVARVGELLSMIEKLNDCVTSNLGDAVRQWSTVANVLAATDNKECLDHFLQLNGLSLLNRWLQEALNLSVDIIVAEELISSLLSFFERSPIDYKRIVASGIGVTIEFLLDHKSISIKEKATILCHKLNQARNDGIYCHGRNKCGTGQDDRSEPSEDVQTSENCVHVVNSLVDIPSCTEDTGEGKCEAEPPGIELQVANTTRCLDSTPLDSTTKERVPTSNQVLTTATNPVNSNTVLADVNSLGSSVISNYCQENLSVSEESSGCVAVQQPSTGTCSQSGQGGDADDQHVAPVSKDVPDSLKEMDVVMREDEPCKSSQRDACSNSSSFAFSASMIPFVAAADQTISCKLDSNNGDCASNAMDYQPSVGVDHVKEGCSITAEKSNAAANLTSSFHGLDFTASNIRNLGDPQLSCQKKEAISTVVKDLHGEVNLKTHKDHFVTSTDFLKVVGTKANEEVGQKSDLGPECLDDALEVARQVAIAVEREVVDYREPFCSSPEVHSSQTSSSDSPQSEEEKKDQPVSEEAGGNSSSAGKYHSGTSSPEKGSEITQNLSSDPENSEKDIESSKPIVPSQESIGKSAVGRSTFDLNSDICSDEPECLLKPIVKMPINVSAPIAVVASSKGAPGLPIAPLCFGGEMGWKGSAATSAFRPASPRRTPDGERTFSGPKPKSDFFDIDLNLAERVDEVDDEPILMKQLPASSSLPSGDSCVEVSLRRTDKLNLDLNRLGDEDTSSYPFSSWKLHFQNGERSLSSASSSSSRQPSHRDFDLNDNPSFSDIGGSHNFDILSTKASESCGGSTPYEPVIKIMGSNIAVEKKDNTNQVHQSSLPNGIKMEPAIFARLLPCTNMPKPPYGYSGLPPGPTMSVPPPYYSPGNISYMVDSRGATVIPHVTGSGGLSIPSSRPPPFLLGPANIPSNVAGFGYSRLGLDLNSGLTSAEGGIREGGSFKQFLSQGHGGWMEEQTKTGFQPSSSSTTLKRKEPDSGWEPYQYGYKQMKSWQ